MFYSNLKISQEEFQQSLRSVENQLKLLNFKDFKVLHFSHKQLEDSVKLTLLTESRTDPFKKVKIIKNKYLAQVQIQDDNLVTNYNIMPKDADKLIALPEDLKHSRDSFMDILDQTFV
ncbi:MAG: hypothetical protein H6622_17065 [Halobacteriovoraceae bacterium]|nr:hypothetical protein [Halobacteriovoraceae bacterium]